MSETLDNTLDELTYNAEKQESVVKEMLGNVVNAYSSAYGKINDIINNTGFQFDSNNSNIGNIGNQSGVQDQYNQAITNQPNVGADKPVTDIDTGEINNNPTNDKIEADISKPIDTTNRPVAEVKISKTSLSLQEGSSGSLSVSIRPTDAANKTIAWSSTNPSVASISNGSVKGLKVGSATIIASTMDGSGLSASCSVSVVTKPKPAPTPSSGGDGVARVGDVVTLKSGQKYYYDSWGAKPAGSKYSGVSRGVVIDSYSGKEYGGKAKNHGGYGVHIKSADGKYGDLGWVRLDQLEGYAKGSRLIDRDQWAITDEEGAELIVNPKDGIQTSAGTLRNLPKGSSVIPHDLSENLFNWGAINPQDFILRSIGNTTPTIPDFVMSDRRNGDNIDVHYDSFLTVNGDIDKEVFPGVEAMCKEAWKYTGSELLKIKNR